MTQPECCRWHTFFRALFANFQALHSGSRLMSAWAISGLGSSSAGSVHIRVKRCTDSSRLLVVATLGRWSEPAAQTSLIEACRPWYNSYLRPAREVGSRCSGPSAKQCLVRPGFTFLTSQSIVALLSKNRQWVWSGTRVVLVCASNCWLSQRAPRPASWGRTAFGCWDWVGALCPLFQPCIAAGRLWAFETSCRSLLFHISSLWSRFVIRFQAPTDSSTLSLALSAMF